MFEVAWLQFNLPLMAKPEFLILNWGAQTLPPTAPTAAFDLNHTILKASNGRGLTDDTGNWVWRYRNVPETLRELSCTHQIVVFSNQVQLAEDRQDHKCRQDARYISYLLHLHLIWVLPKATHRSMETSVRIKFTFMWNLLLWR
jgi:hypothetical protein